MVSKVLSWNKRFSKLAYGRKQSIKLRARTPLPGIGCVPQVFPREHGKRWRLIWRGVMGHLAPALSLNLLCVIHPSWGKSPTETATSPSLCTCLSLGQDQFTGLFSSLSHATASFWDTSLSWFPPGSQLDRISAHLAQELKNHLLQPKCLTHIQILSGHLAKSFQRMVNFRIQEGSVVTFSDPRALKKKKYRITFLLPGTLFRCLQCPHYRNSSSSPSSSTSHPTLLWSLGISQEMVMCLRPCHRGRYQSGIPSSWLCPGPASSFWGSEPVDWLIDWMF